MRFLLPALFAGVFVTPAVADHSKEPDIVRTAAAAGSFKTLLNCLIAADLLDALKADGPFTVFAPTDEAFARLPKGTLESLLKPENRNKLSNILGYHVIPNKSRFNPAGAEVGQKYPFKTLGGQNVTITKDTGGALSVNGNSIQKVVQCRNGSVQIIDTVLLPGESDGEEKKTIVSVAVEAKSFKTLVVALKAAELDTVLAGKGPFTVFAPTDEAFARLPKGTVEKLLKPENREQLVAVLKYHVVAGKVSAKAAAAAGTAKTLEGEAVTISIRDGRLTINESAVVKSDIDAGNGIVHAIDRVLLPGK